MGAKQGFTDTLAPQGELPVDEALLYRWTEQLPPARGIYVVGGTLRDLLLGLDPTDCDLATAGDPQAYARRLAGATGGRLVPLGKPGKMVYRVVAAERVYDVCPVEGGSIENDLRRRDFTINALALEIPSGRILDVTGGRDDIRARRIRMVSRHSLEADPLRMLRAFRIGAALGFEVEAQTDAAIRSLAKAITAVAPERLHEELIKFFRTPVSHAYLVQMARTGLLFETIPALAPLSGCGQNRHHRYDVWQHTLVAYGYLEKALGTTPPPGAAAELAAARTVKPEILKFAMLLHDIGKPLVRTTEGTAVHFHGHPEKGAQLTAGIAERLRCSSLEKEQLCFLVENHLRPLQLFLLGERGKLTKRALARFFIRCGPRTPDVLLLSLADHAGKGPDEDDTFCRFAADLLQHFRREAAPRLAQPLPINGHDLEKRLGLAPSPLFARILAEVRRALLTGEVTDRGTALALAARIARRENPQKSTVS